MFTGFPYLLTVSLLTGQLPSCSRLPVEISLSRCSLRTEANGIRVAGVLSINALHSTDTSKCSHTHVTTLVIHCTLWALSYLWRRPIAWLCGYTARRHALYRPLRYSLSVCLTRCENVPKAIWLLCLSSSRSLTLLELYIATRSESAVGLFR